MEIDFREYNSIISNTKGEEMNKHKSKYKMLVLDMDYTLLNKDKIVSERNKIALSEARKQGVIIVVATGRLYTSAKYYSKLLGMETPIIASNGAIIRERHTNKTLFESLLPDKAILKMIELCKSKDMYCHLYTKDTIFTEKIINISYRYTQWNNSLKEEDRIKIKIVDSLDDLVIIEKGNILKAVVIDENRDNIKYVRDSIYSTGLVEVTQSLRDNVEVMNVGVSKGNAVKFLAKKYDVDRENIIAIGDNENDISMIQYAGLGIAMGNASDSVKNKADYVTADYQNDGVGVAVEKFIL